MNIRVLVVILTVVSLVRGISPPSKPVPNGLGVSPSASPAKPAPPKPTIIPAMPVSTNPGIVPPPKPTLVSIGSNPPPMPSFIPTLPGIIPPPKPTIIPSINFGIPPPKPTIIPAVPISINPGIIVPPKPTLPPLIAPPKPTRTFSFGFPITKPTGMPTSVVTSGWTVVITTTVTSCDWDAYNRNIVYPREPRIRAASYPYPFVAPQVHPYQPIDFDLNPKDLKKINKLVDKVVASKLKQFVRDYDDAFDDDF